MGGLVGCGVPQFRLRARNSPAAAREAIARTFMMDVGAWIRRGDFGEEERRVVRGGFDILKGHNIYQNPGLIGADDCCILWCSTSRIASTLELWMWKSKTHNDCGLVLDAHMTASER